MLNYYQPMKEFEIDSVTLNTYFDRIFYINLRKDVARNEKLLIEFNKAGLTNYERIDGIQLTVLPCIEKYRNFIKNDPRYILGSLSCRASHIECVKIAKERDYKKILILEDDVIFLQNPNQLLQQNLPALTEWDLLYFGGLIEQQFRNQIVGAFAYGVRNTLFDEILNMTEPSGMEIDNFYAKILQHMSHNYNPSGKYNVKIIRPFNQITFDRSFASNIRD